MKDLIATFKVQNAVVGFKTNSEQTFFEICKDFYASKMSRKGCNGSVEIYESNKPFPNSSLLLIRYLCTFIDLFFMYSYTLLSNSWASISHGRA